MSSLTTANSSMEEESPEPEELVDTRLSLVIGAGSRPPPPVQTLVPEDQAPGRKRKKESGGGATSPRSKITTRTTHGSNADDDEGRADGGGRATKKLRLTGEQAALLEHTFRAHNILSHGEKNDLARRVGLRPRQVEVWFQNRRARTKLKQTEVDRELLRRWCEHLSAENARLRREIADLRSSSAVSRLAAACPSCSKLAGVRIAAGS